MNIESLEKDLTIGDVSKLIMRYFDTASEIGLKDEFLRFIGIKNESDYQKFENLIKRKGNLNNSFESAVRRQIYKLFQLDKEAMFKGKEIEWKFARVSDDYIIPTYYKSFLSKEGILALDRVKENTVFGDLFIFKIIEKPDLTITLMNGEFNFIN